jgi:uncharacterized protein (TIGR00251 family)
MIKLLIKVKPNSAKDEISVDAENNITVKIRTKPVDGEANEYLLKYLAKELGISRSLVQIEKGAVSRLNRIMINIELVEFDTIIKKWKG